MRRGQVWMLDLFFGLLVFTVTLTIFFKSEINLSDSDEKFFDDLVFESKLVSDSLMGKGYPSSWTPYNVSEIGITDDYRINLSKLDRFQQMNYTTSKTRLRTKFNYYVFFEGTGGPLRISGSREGVGKPGVNSTNILSRENPHSLVRINRFVIFKSQPARMVVYLWA